MNLFDPPRERFLRLLHGKYRGLAAEVLIRLHEQFFGPVSEPLTLLSEDLRNLIEQASATAPVYATDDDDARLIQARDFTEREREEVSGNLTRNLVDDGWLERYFADLRPALRFTRAGKLMAGALADIVSPRRRTRLRNMRSVRNALHQFHENGDPDDLADALHYAAAMSEELTDDIQSLQDQGRELLRRQDEAFDHLAELNRRMDGDYAPRLLADNVDAHSSDIIVALDKIRFLPALRKTELETHLERELPWLVEEASGHGSILEYALDRVHTIVLYICRPRQATMVREIQTVTRLMAQIVGHQHLVRSASSTSSLSRLIASISTWSDDERERRLRCFAHAVTFPSIRLLDPSRVRIVPERERRRSDGLGVDPVIEWDTRLNQVIEQAVDTAIAMDPIANGKSLAEQLKERGVLFFSDLAPATPQDVLHAVFAVTHLNDIAPISVQPLSDRAVTSELLETYDLLIQQADVRPPLG